MLIGFLRWPVTDNNIPGAKGTITAGKGPLTSPFFPSRPSVNPKGQEAGSLERSLVCLDTACVHKTQNTFQRESYTKAQGRVSTLLSSEQGPQP